MGVATDHGLVQISESGDWVRSKVWWTDGEAKRVNTEQLNHRRN